MNRTKLTPFVKKKLVELIELGVPEGKAAIAVGITPQTFINWKHRAELYNPDNGTSGDDIFFNLFNELDQAEARFIEKNVRRIDKAADKDVDNAKWMLERRDADDFGKREPSVLVESKILIAMQDNFSRLKSPNLIEEKGVTRSEEGVTNEGD